MIRLLLISIVVTNVMTCLKVYLSLYLQTAERQQRKISHCILFCRLYILYNLLTLVKISVIHQHLPSSNIEPSISNNVLMKSSNWNYEIDTQRRFFRHCAVGQFMSVVNLIVIKFSFKVMSENCDVLVECPFFWNLWLLRYTIQD